VPGTTISFFGASGEVTGSCYLVETGRARVLVDFGLHQGGREADERNHRLPPIDAKRLDAVVLTHAHIDHCGRLPLLVTNGYRGEIHATPATADLTGILLRDSAQLQEADARHDAVRAARRGETALPALYSPDEVERLLPMFQPLPYAQPREIAPGVTIRLVEAGHILGSASVEMKVAASGASAPLTILFSGDLGQRGTPLLKDFTPPRSSAAQPAIEPDVVVMESTYGDRDHRPLAETVEEFTKILTGLNGSGGKVLVPAFAVGRTQQLVYHLGELVRAGKVQRLPVYVDSPMAAEATDLYRRHTALFDEDTQRILSNGDSPFSFPGLSYLRTGDESRTLNTLDGRAMIIAASGMCTGGRIMHHLRHHLWKPDTHVIIAGFQAAGSIGRQLVDRVHRVMVWGEPVVVRAKVHTLGGFSAHAGQTDLLRWAAPLKGSNCRLFLTHGERGPRQILANRLRETTGLQATCPEYHEVATL